MPRKKVLNFNSKQTLQNLFLKYEIEVPEKFWREFNSWLFNYLKDFITGSFNKALSNMMQSAFMEKIYHRDNKTEGTKLQ